MPEEFFLSILHTAVESWFVCTYGLRTRTLLQYADTNQTGKSACRSGPYMKQ